ncbi:TPA: hypothetical protein QC096_003215 [Bacillus thuringiensis]|nr:hypothetical protein [Bacillus thuringiensis]
MIDEEFLRCKEIAKNFVETKFVELGEFYIESKKILKIYEKFQDRSKYTKLQFIKLMLVTYKLGELLGLDDNKSCMSPNETKIIFALRSVGLNVRANVYVKNQKWDCVVDGINNEILVKIDVQSEATHSNEEQQKIDKEKIKKAKRMEKNIPVLVFTGKQINYEIDDVIREVLSTLQEKLK